MKMATFNRIEKKIGISALGKEEMNELNAVGFEVRDRHEFSIRYLAIINDRLAVGDRKTVREAADLLSARDIITFITNYYYDREEYDKGDEAIHLARLAMTNDEVRETLDDDEIRAYFQRDPKIRQYFK